MQFMRSRAEGEGERAPISWRGWGGPPPKVHGLYGSAQEPLEFGKSQQATTSRSTQAPGAGDEP